MEPPRDLDLIGDFLSDRMIVNVKLRLCTGHQQLAHRVGVNLTALALRPFGEEFLQVGRSRFADGQIRSGLIAARRALGCDRLR